MDISTLQEVKNLIEDRLFNAQRTEVDCPEVEEPGLWIAREIVKEAIAKADAEMSEFYNQLPEEEEIENE